MWHLTTVALLFVCGVYCQTRPPIFGNQGCSNNAVALANPDPCSRQYYRCENNAWLTAMCVGGVINNLTGVCVPRTNECPDPGLTVRTYTTRHRRQAISADNCLRTYACPANLQRVVIYPDWVNTSCDTYVVCANGSLVLSSCKVDGYSFYNPARLSCEESASSTNTCVYRTNTVLLSS